MERRTVVLCEEGLSKTRGEVCDKEEEKLGPFAGLFSKEREQGEREERQANGR